MDPDEIALVRASFAKVLPISEQAATLFYARLFELAPGVRPLFPTDMKEQGRRLMQMLAQVVGSLHQLQTIVPAIQALARRHVGYGAVPAHYAVVGAALIWTLQQGLVDAFTPQTEAAWGKAYGILSNTMIEAAA